MRKFGSIKKCNKQKHLLASAQQVLDGGCVAVAWIHPVDFLEVTLKIGSLSKCIAREVQNCMLVHLANETKLVSMSTRWCKLVQEPLSRCAGVRERDWGGQFRRWRSGECRVVVVKELGGLCEGSSECFFPLDVEQYLIHPYPLPCTRMNAFKLQRAIPASTGVVYLIRWN